MRFEIEDDTLLYLFAGVVGFATLFVFVFFAVYVSEKKAERAMKAQVEHGIEK